MKSSDRIRNDYTTPVKVEELPPGLSHSERYKSSQPMKMEEDPPRLSQPGRYNHSFPMKTDDDRPKFTELRSNHSTPPLAKEMAEKMPNPYIHVCHKK